MVPSVDRFFRREQVPGHDGRQFHVLHGLCDGLQNDFVRRRLRFVRKLIAFDGVRGALSVRRRRPIVRDRFGGVVGRAAAVLERQMARVHLILVVVLVGHGARLRLRRITVAGPREMPARAIAQAAGRQYCGRRIRVVRKRGVAVRVRFGAATVVRVLPVDAVDQLFGAPGQRDNDVLGHMAGLVGVARIVGAVVLLGCDADVVRFHVVRETFVRSRRPCQPLKWRKWTIFSA